MRNVTSNACRYFARPLLHCMFLVPMGAFILLGILLGLLGRGEEARAGWWVAGILFLISLPFYFLIWRMRVRLSSRGISVLGPGCHAETSWENLERWYLSPGRAGLVTRTPMTGKKIERLRRLQEGPGFVQPPYDEMERRWLRAGCYIPLRGFEHIVQKGTLQRAIARYAPDLPGLEASPSAVSCEIGSMGVKHGVGFWTTVFVLPAAVGFLLLLPEEFRESARSVVLLLLCIAGAIRMAFAAAKAWRGRFRLLAVLYGVLSLLLASLCFAWI